MIKNNSYVQKRNSEKAIGTIRSDIAQTAHDSNIEKRVRNYAHKICAEHGLPERMKGKLASLMYADPDNVRLLPGKIDKALEVLNIYGYGVEVLENNFSLLNHTSADLMNALAIANQYGFDEEILVHYSFYSNNKANTLYSLTEELKANGVEPNFNNVNKLYIEINNAGKLLEFNESHPVDQRKVFLYRTLYDRKLKEMQSQKTLSKTK